MSVAQGVPGPDGPQSGQKVILSRAPRAMWGQIETHWADGDARKWRSLAMLHLQTHCGWSVTMVARAFGLHKGQASRKIHECKRQLADVFEPPTGEGHGAETEEFPADEFSDQDFPTDDDE